MLPTQPHNLTWLLVTENQIAAVCTNGGEEGGGKRHARACPVDPCPPVPPPGSGPFTQVFANRSETPGSTGPFGLDNLHRQYIEGVRNRGTAHIIGG